jgi:hypothetical protein
MSSTPVTTRTGRRVVPTAAAAAAADSKSASAQAAAAAAAASSSGSGTSSTVGPRKPGRPPRASMKVAEEKEKGLSRYNNNCDRRRENERVVVFVLTRIVVLYV